MSAGIDTGDTAWMLVATALVLMMTPALGLFYAGLVRSKNTLNTFMMSIAAIAVAAVTWAAVGYSLAFDGGGSLIGGLGNAFLQGQFRHSDLSYGAGDVNHTLGEAWAGIEWRTSSGWALQYLARWESPELVSGPGSRSFVWGLSLIHI